MRALFSLAIAFAVSDLSFTSLRAGGVDWTHWRGPLQSGAATEHYEKHELSETPLWTVDLPGQGTPLIIDGKVYAFGYRGEFDDLVETLTCLEETTGKILWEKSFRDFISDTAYNRYAIGSPAYDAETKQLYLQTTNGVLMALDAATGQIKWSHSLMESVGRLTFPNGRTGAPVVEGDLVIVHVITANWGAAGPANDRLYAYDKKTGEFAWFTSTGIQPKDSSHSTPYVETRYGRRMLYVGTGDGNLTGFNARTGEPLLRFQLSKMGVGGSPVIVNDQIIGVHNDENIDTSESGRLVGVKLPAVLPPKPSDPTITSAPALPKEAEAWRVPVGSFTSSPTAHGTMVYQLTQQGSLVAVDTAKNALAWEMKLAEDNLHSSPLYVDGLLYCPMKGSAEAGGGYSAYLHIIKPSAEKGEVVKTLRLKGEANGQPAVAHGRLYVHTKEKLYCFQIGTGEIKTDAIPAVDIPKPGRGVALQIIPQEVVLEPGAKAKFRIHVVDEHGFVCGEVKKVQWESYIPPTARIKAKADAAFNSEGELVAGSTISAGAFKATLSDNITGVIRCRVVPSFSQKQDFEDFQLNENHASETGVTFAYPPLPWMGARFKWEVREQDGSKVLAKTLDQIFFQRTLTFIGTEQAKNYTIQADVMTDGNRRLKSEVGLVHQRYLITLKGNDNAINVSSNYERLNHQVPFAIKANQWYTMKTRVENKPDGTAVIMAKAWERGQPEPSDWIINHEHKNGHTHGAPGVFGFSPQSQKRVFIDNIIVTPHS